MTADIEFRWVKRTEERRTKMAEHGWQVDIDEIKTLQFRKMTVSEMRIYEDGKPEISHTIEWSKWKDVPVVEE